MVQKASNIVWHKGHVSKQDRQQLKFQQNAVLWFTGLSGAGKSTISSEVEKKLYETGYHTYVLDGDNIRHGLNKDLGFSEEDRKENIRRIGEVAKLLVDAGLITLSAFISPFREDRKMVRDMLGHREFIEIYIKCSLQECEHRDPKGLYKKARAGEIKNFTGISSPYEEPEHAELVIETDKQSLEKSVQQVIQYLEDNGYIKMNK
jgi:adenylylsulfate kinase